MRDVSQSRSVSDKAKQCSELGLIKRNIRDILLVVEDIRNVNSCALTAMILSLLKVLFCSFDFVIKKVFVERNFGKKKIVVRTSVAWTNDT